MSTIPGEKYFENGIEFKNYVITYKPAEIWLDDFSEENPYLSNLKYFERNKIDMISWTYTSQCFYVNNLNNIKNSFEKGMYVKLNN